MNDFQKKKFSHLFRVLDHNRDHAIDMADLESIVTALAKERGLSASAPPMVDLHKKYGALHKAMIEGADTNRDGKVSLDEYLAYHQALVADEAKYKSTIVGITAIFGQVLDRDADGKNDVDDYRSFLRAMHVDDGQAATIFARLDKNGDGHITATELQDLLHEFYFETAPGAPGNQFFGAL
jgi:Ca2+-binding EF-hand superfamily protein